MTDWLPGKLKEEKYVRFIKYMLSGTVAALIEIAMFVIIYYVILPFMEEAMKINIANLVSRVGSSYINYELNRKYVFGSKKRDKIYLLKYSILWIVQLEISNLAIYYALTLLGIEAWVSKMILDQVLGFASYQAQLYWVFKKKEK
jgi:dolichol-phosphate mannosyltransferase